jgi:hypothetical protein
MLVGLFKTRTLVTAVNNNKIAECINSPSSQLSAIKSAGAAVFCLKSHYIIIIIIQ